MDNNTTLLLSVALFILAVFGSAWLNLRQLTKVLEANKDELKAELKGEISGVKSEISAVRSEIVSLKTEINRLDQRIDSMEKRLDRIERQLDQIFKPIGTLGS